MIYYIDIDLVIPEKPKATSLAYCWNDKGIRGTKRLTKEVHLIEELWVSEMKHT